MMRISIPLVLCLLGMANLSAQSPKMTDQQKSSTASSSNSQTVENQENNQDIKDSVQAAQAWLELIDKGDYGKSWDTGAKLFQLTMARDEWQKAMELLRKPLGRMNSREVIDQRTATNPKGLPPGEYMVLFYKTSFSNRSSANELITLMKEGNSQWRVLTYQAR